MTSLEKKGVEAPKYLKKISNMSIVDSVIDRLTNAILDRELKPGDKIPTESELASGMGIGRNSVREAIKVLEFMGILEIRHAEGTFVTTGFKSQMFNPLLYGIVLKSGSFDEVCQFRGMLDSGVLHIAVGVATDGDIKRCEAAFEKYKETISGEDIDYDDLFDSDAEFHSCIYAATHNELIISTGALINRITRYSRINNLKRLVTDGKQAQSIQTHRGMLEILKQHRGEDVETIVARTYSLWQEQPGQP